MPLLKKIIKSFSGLFKKKSRKKKRIKKKASVRKRKKVVSKRSGVTKKKVVRKRVKKRTVKKKTLPRKKKTSVKKVVRKKKVKTKKKKKVPQKSKGQKKLSNKGEDAPKGELIGEITHYFSGISVVVLKMNKGKLSVGEQILIRGHNRDFKQKVDSLQIESVDVKVVRKGQLAGLKVKKLSKPGDKVYRLT